MRKTLEDVYIIIIIIIMLIKIDYLKELFFTLCCCNVYLSDVRN